MSPAELSRKRVSAQTQWWTAGSPLVSCSLQHSKVLGSSSACSHCRRSSHSPFTSMQHRAPTKHRTCTDCSSHTSDNTEPISNTAVPQVDHQMCWSYSPWFCSWMVFSTQTAGYSNSQSKETPEARSASTSSSFSSPWDPTANRRKLPTPRPWANTSSQEKLGTEKNKCFYSVKENMTYIRILVFWCVFMFCNGTESWIHWCLYCPSLNLCLYLHLTINETPTQECSNTTVASNSVGWLCGGAAGSSSIIIQVDVPINTADKKGLNL